MGAKKELRRRKEGEGEARNAKTRRGEVMGDETRRKEKGNIKARKGNIWEG